MPKVILCPAYHNEHFAATVDRLVPMTRIMPHVSNTDIRRLRDVFGDHGAALWGVTDSNYGSWVRIQPGDIVLFTRKDIFASATVEYTAHSESLAAAMWGRNEEGQTWEYLLFLCDVQHDTIAGELVKRAIGWAGNARFQRFTVLDDARSRRLMALIDLPGAP